MRNIRSIVAPFNPAHRVYITNKDSTLAKLREFKCPFQVVSDFDSTLSRFRVNDKETSSISLISKVSRLTRMPSVSSSTHGFTTCSSTTTL